jgi:hypothetical protein
MGIFDTDWGDYFSNSPSLKMAKEGWNASLPGKAVNAVAEPIVSGATYPGDVYAGRELAPIPSQNPDLSRAADLALMMPMGGAVASATRQIPEQAIGTFGGPFAKDAPIKNYMAASKMERKGASPQDIWHEQGIFRDGGMLQHEIPDREARLIIPDREFLGGFKDILKHPRLERAYPDLGKAITHVKPGEGSGSYVAADPTKMNTAMISATGHGDDLRSILLHEGEHAIQGREGRYGVGARTQSQPSDFAEYLALPEERAARRVENRADWTDEQLKATHPLMTPEKPHIQRILDEYDKIKSGTLAKRERQWF